LTWAAPLPNRVATGGLKRILGSKSLQSGEQEQKSREMSVLVNSRTHSVQLDVLRGLAIVLMIVNHAGVSLVGSNQEQFRAISALIFLGSFAPVVFFFTTGFGIGISRRGGTWVGFGSTLLKAGLLVLADQFMFWKSGIQWGLDFLGFIGLSSVLVTAVSHGKKPLRICSGLIVGLLLLRFGLGPPLRDHLNLPRWVGWLLGVAPLDNVSYPLAPWLVYPLLGFVIARRVHVTPGTTRDFRWIWMGIVGFSALALAGMMYRAHAAFFRWGTMNFAFFVLSIAVGTFFFWAAWQIGARWPRAARFLSVRGIVSFAVVPIHYGLIELCSVWGGARDGAGLLGEMAALVIVSVALSRFFAAGVNLWISRVLPGVAWIAMSTLVLICMAILWFVPQQGIFTFPAFVIGQLAIAALLAVRSQRRDGPGHLVSRFERTQSS
jgi:uncharacterized membrane protein